MIDFWDHILRLGLSKLHNALKSFQKGLEISPNDPQCLKGLRETQAQIQKNMMTGPNEEQQKRALEDPEIRQIYSDPMVSSIICIFVHIHGYPIQSHFCNVAWTFVCRFVPH